MSMSRHVLLLRDENDHTYRVNTQALIGLRDAGIHELPPPLNEYFGISDCGEFEEGVTGLEVKDVNGAVEDYREDMREGFRVDVTKLPPGVKSVLVFNSY